MVYKKWLMQQNIHTSNFVELAWFIQMQIMKLLLKGWDNEKVKVYELDCKSEIYKTVEIKGELVEVEQKGNILYLKGNKWINQ